MTMSGRGDLSLEELAKEYTPIGDDPGIKRIRNWGLPNTAEEANEEIIRVRMEKDERNYLAKVQRIFEE